MQVLAQEGEDLATCGSSRRDEAGHAQEAVDGPRVAGQACVGAVGAEAFDGAESGRDVDREGDPGPTADGTTSYVSLTPGTAVNPDGWTRLTGTATVSWSGALSGATFYVETASGTGGFSVDDVSLQ